MSDFKQAQERALKALNDAIGAADDLRLSCISSEHRAGLFNRAYDIKHGLQDLKNKLHSIENFDENFDWK